MAGAKLRFSVWTWTMLGLVLLVALFFEAYRTDPDLGFLVAWVAYSAGLIRIMAWFKWADIAMSVCFLLILFPLLVAGFMSAARAFH